MANIHFGKPCPYCQFPIKQDSEVIVCIECKIPHHKECWEENDGCTTFGFQCYNRGEAPDRPLAHLRAVEKKVEKKLALRPKEKVDIRAKERFLTGAKILRAIVIGVAVSVLLIWVMYGIFIILL